MILTYLGTDLDKLTDNELMELYNNPNLNPISKNEINIELAKRLK